MKGGSEMKVRIIKTRQDYETARERLSVLMSRQPEPGSMEEHERELLVVVIQAFERELFCREHADPVDSILFRMEQRQLQRKDLVRYLGSVSRVSEVLARKRRLTLPMIRRLHKGLDIPAEILIEEIEITA